VNSVVKLAAVAALALAVAVGVGPLLPSRNDVGSGPSPSATPIATPVPIRDGPLPAGTYVATPFSAPGSDLCWSPPQPGCIDAIPDDDIRFTFTVPKGWSGLDDSVGTLIGMGNPTGAAIIFGRGPWPYDDPCTGGSISDMIPVGPTAADFADALAALPLLDVTAPVDVTLAGYTGKYLELQVPLDLTGCEVYRPWEPWYYAQGPGERWHLTILDVEGLRIVIQAMDHEETSAQHKAELQAIVDSIEIEPATTPAGSPSPSADPIAWSPASALQDWPAPVRVEPVGDPIVVPLAGAYTDPSGDIASSEVPWVDIRSVTRSGCNLCVDYAADPPQMPTGSNEPWTAYGLVLDTDRDGVADVRYGMDGIQGSRVWRTDLHSGRTEIQDEQTWLCDCLIPGMFLAGGRAHILVAKENSGPFYVWASVIRDGRVVATDYAPDTGWLGPNP
jgi:hypothetical protein